VSQEKGKPVVVRDARTGALAWTGSSGWSDFAVLDARGEVVVGQGSSLRFHDLESGELTREHALEGAVVFLRPADGGRALLVRRGNGMQREHSAHATDLELTSTADLERLGRWPDHAGGALSADGATLFATDQIESTTVAIDLASGSVRELRDASSKQEHHEQLSLLALGIRDGAIEIWDTEEQSLALTLEGHPDRAITDLSFHPDGSRLASVAENDASVRIWDVATGELLCTLRLALDYGDQRTAAWTRGIRSVAFSADGRRLVVGARDGSVWVFETDLEQARGLWGASGWR
jgi:WD40 repeat protein